MIISSPTTEFLIVPKQIILFELIFFKMELFAVSENLRRVSSAPKDQEGAQKLFCFNSITKNFERNKINILFIYDIFVKKIYS